MTTLGCGCRPDCTGLAVVASVIIGIIAAFLQFTAVITLTPAFLWVVFGIAIVYLAITLWASLGTRGPSVRACICQTLPVLLFGILGTVLFSLILLAVTIVAGSTIFAILSGALLAFFTLLVTTAACLASCAAGCQNNQTAA